MITAGRIWLLIVLIAVVFEVYAGSAHQQTLSQWVWMVDAKYGWFRYVVLGFVGLLMVHFFVVHWP